jgi:hypothetical protein
VTSKNDGVLATGTFDNLSVTNSVSLTSLDTGGGGGDVAVPPGPRGQDKWKKLNSSLLELVGRKKDLMDVLD